MMMFREIFVLEHYRPASAPRSVILDCGSNIGLSVLFFRGLFPDVPIVAFEPNPNTYALLERNLAVNRIDNVDARNIALKHKQGNISLYVQHVSSTSGHTSTERRRGGPVELSVRAARLSDTIEGRVDLVKLDVEGDEHEVIGDLVASQKIGLVEEMIIEYHHHLDPDTDRLADFLGLLEGSGFGYQLQVLGFGERADFQDVLIYAYTKRRMRPER
jgi:FkbM family methyltransferase